MECGSAKLMVHPFIPVRKLLQDINKLRYWVATDIGLPLILQREELGHMLSTDGTVPYTFSLIYGKSYGREVTQEARILIDFCEESRILLQSGYSRAR